MALEIERSVIEIGIEKPIRFLQITDLHMDIVKSENKWENTEYFEEAMKYAKEKADFLSRRKVLRRRTLFSCNS